jgi:hypothetical protein
MVFSTASLMRILKGGHGFKESTQRHEVPEVEDSTGGVEQPVWSEHNCGHSPPLRMNFVGSISSFRLEHCPRSADTASNKSDLKSAVELAKPVWIFDSGWGSPKQDF